MKNLIDELFGESNGSHHPQPNSNPESKESANRQLELDTLEPRVLFSGAPVEAPDQANEAQTASANPDQGGDAQAAAESQEGLIADETGLDRRGNRV